MKLENCGVFLRILRNLSEKFASFFLHNVDYPSKPLTVVTTPSNTSVLLTWTDGWPLGDLPIFYTIYCVTEDKFGTYPKQNRIIDYTNYNATFNALLPYTEYKFTVCAHNNVSFSNKDESETNCETKTVETKEGCKYLL